MEENKKKEFDAKKMRKYLYDGDKRNWGLRNEQNPCTYCKRRLHAEDPYCNFYDCCRGRGTMDNLMMWESDGTATEREIDMVFEWILDLCGVKSSPCACCKGYEKNEDFFCADELDENGRRENGHRVVNSCKYYDSELFNNILCKNWQDNGENPEYSEMRRVFLEKGSLAVIWHKVQTRLLKEKLVKAFEKNSAEIAERKEYIAEYKERNNR